MLGLGGRRGLCLGVFAWAACRVGRCLGHLRLGRGGALWRHGLAKLERRQRLESAARLRTPLGFERGQVAPLPQLTAMLVKHPKIHEKVRRQHVRLDVGAHDVQRSFLAHQLEERVQQAAGAKTLGRIEGQGHTRSGLRPGHQARARSLVQSFQ